MMKCSVNTALEQREKPLDSICRDAEPFFIAHVFIGGMVHKRVFAILNRFRQHSSISNQMRIAVGHFCQYCFKVLSGNSINVSRVNLAASLDYGKDCLFTAANRAIFTTSSGLNRVWDCLARTASDECFISLNYASHLFRQLTSQ